MVNKLALDAYAMYEEFSNTFCNRQNDEIMTIDKTLYKKPNLFVNFFIKHRKACNYFVKVICFRLCNYLYIKYSGNDLFNKKIV